MDFFRTQLLRIQQQIGDLSASQKMLTAALVTIMVMTLVLWTRYSGQAEMEALLDQPLSIDDIANIKSHLSARRVKYSVTGERIMVPADLRSELVAELAYAKLLPRNTQTAFDNEIMKQMGPWTPESQKRELFNKMKEITLARVIGGLPDVAHAVVLIDPTEERRFAADRRQSTATVTIETRNPGQRPGKDLINAAADIVVGAQSGLARSRISVIVDGVPYTLHDKEDDSLASSDYLEMKQAAERAEANRISEHLNIPGAMVAVTVSLNTQSVQRREQSVDPTKLVHKERNVRERSVETTAPLMSAQEPGAAPNVGMTIPTGAGGGDGSSTESETETEFDLITSQIVEESKTPAGDSRIVRASVRVPRSYFINVVRAKDPKMTEPDDAILGPVIASELPKIRDAVKACTSLSSDDDVIVQDYIDVMPMLAAAPQTPATGMSSMLGGYSKEIAVGALAVVSLFMVLMMVRKGSPAPIIPRVIEQKPAPRLASAEVVAGEVSEGNPLLDGMELDEDAVKTQQMLNQVTTMVDENPDAAANLVKRWLNRS